VIGGVVLNEKDAVAAAIKRGPPHLLQERHIGLVDSSCKCDKSEEAAAQTFLFRRKPLLPMA
jgi:hypothetical protein